MIHDQDPHIRLQFARDRAERLAEEMRRSRGLTPDEVGYPRLGPTRVRARRPGRARLRRRRHVPAYQA